MRQAEALAIKNGRIMAVGKRREIMERKGKTTQVIDLEGQTLLPGFIEAHSHITASLLGMAFGTLVFQALCPKGEDVWRVVKEKAAAAKPGAWLFFFGIDPLVQDGFQLPPMEEMDGYAPENPMIIGWANGHTFFGNSLAYRAANISKDTPDPPGGRYCKDGNGELTGRADETAAWMPLMKPFSDSIFKDPTSIMRGMAKYFSVMASNGVTTVTDELFIPDYTNLMIAASLLPNAIRTRAYAFTPTGQVWAPPFFGNDMFTIAGVKMVVDGSPFTGTMASCHGYIDSDFARSRGEIDAHKEVPVFQNESKELITNMYRLCLAQGYPAHFHVEGDKTIGAILDIIEAALQENPVKDHRTRLEHCAQPTYEEMQRCARLGVGASHTIHHLCVWGDMLPQLFGEDNVQNWNPFRWDFDLGVPCSMHFDGPMTLQEPLWALQTAVTRKTPSGRVLNAKQCITIEEALQAYTRIPAWQLFMEEKVGTLEKGKYADLVLLTRNPRNVEPERLREIKVHSTYVAGKRVWNQEGN